MHHIHDGDPEGKRTTYRHPTIRAELDGSEQCSTEGITAYGPSPVLGLCRLLVAAGLDPNLPLEVFRGPTLVLQIRAIGDAAQLEVNSKGTGFIRCRQAVRTAPPMRKKGPRDIHDGFWRPHQGGAP